ncbi:MAG: nucleotidyl transferase AbiEii/AbiGii toxin family protein [Chlamydiota bacterium]
MKISKQRLIRESGQTGFRPEILEKVWRLMNVLEGIYAHPFLKDKLVLKGGTALNLFIFDLPRLSVDIDLNYIGKQSREEMLKQRPLVEKNMEAVFYRENLSIRRIPTKHAGGKWQLKYPSVLTAQGNLEIDLNFMFRVSLWENQRLSSQVVGNHQIHNIPVLNLHELAAGKLTALFARHAARDLFDMHHLFTKVAIDQEQLRFGFILYLAMSSIKSPHDISSGDLLFNRDDFQKQLVPVLRNVKSQNALQLWQTTKLEQCKRALSLLFPFNKQEKEFLKNLTEKGEVISSLLTNDLMMQAKIEKMPLLKWKASRVQKKKDQ